MLKENVNSPGTEPSNMPWSLLDSEGFPEINRAQAVSDATGTTTHSATEPRDLNVDDS